MDQLRDGIWTVGYGEKNPLVEYKIEGFRLFNDMMAVLKQEILEYMMKVVVEHAIEEMEYEYGDMGEEFHADVEQFGSGGIPVSASPQRRAGSKQKKESAPVEGGSKRKKTRRNRRR
jgi:preprotein translocase subunit SecA